jgi:hypothetical protein
MFIVVYINLGLAAPLSCFYISSHMLSHIICYLVLLYCWELTPNLMHSLLHRQRLCDKIIDIEVHKLVVQQGTC